MRPRLHWLGITVLTIALGLLTRPLKRHYEELGSALGDALWALMVFFLLGTLFPRLAPLRLAAAALLVAVLVEVSQLWHTPVLNAIRHSTLGALAIGGSFSFGDIACYSVGVLVGFLLDRALRR